MPRSQPGPRSGCQHPSGGLSLERLRITYSKTTPMRYTSNLNIHKIWERTLRRARLPLAYSEGFHPQPRLIQASPLPLGLLSRVEMIDIWLESEPGAEPVAEKLAVALPPGLEVQSITPIELLAPALPAQVRSAEYVAAFLTPVDRDELAGRVNRLLGAPELRRERRGKIYDLRPVIEALEVLPDLDAEGHSCIFMRLSARENATGRAEEVLITLEYDPFDTRIERVKLILNSSE